MEDYVKTLHGPLCGEKTTNKPAEPFGPAGNLLNHTIPYNSSQTAKNDGTLQ
ncbi:hypothetical protein LCL90_02500 [Bacillus infantis]|uniref:hypothetical protein n=1 Tax=Bacillus infantis TaxID=324767 RepID=UPI001CD60498|nr:hypothetical protein [Bacillus infantis]MCA1033490.1 hypothetical protein [Bacillus infantis]